jgi:hypothetical protein
MQATWCCGFRRCSRNVRVFGVKMGARGQPLRGDGRPGVGRAARERAPKPTGSLGMVAARLGRAERSPFDHLRDEDPSLGPDGNGHGQVLRGAGFGDFEHYRVFATKTAAVLLQPVVIDSGMAAIGEPSLGYVGDIASADHTVRVTDLKTRCPRPRPRQRLRIESAPNRRDFGG